MHLRTTDVPALYRLAMQSHVVAMRMGPLPVCPHAEFLSAPNRPGEPTCGAQDALERVIGRIFEPEGPDVKPPPERAELVGGALRVGRAGGHVLWTFSPVFSDMICQFPLLASSSVAT